MKRPWNEAVWMAYYKEMRRFNRGERPDKPCVPLQYGPHIDSMPREHNAQLPLHVMLVEAEVHG